MDQGGPTMEMLHRPVDHMELLRDKEVDQKEEDHHQEEELIDLRENKDQSRSVILMGVQDQRIYQDMAALEEQETESRELESLLPLIGRTEDKNLVGLYLAFENSFRQK